MKIKNLLLLGVLFFSFNSKAQHEININVSNALLFEFNINYEGMLDQYNTLGLMGGYVYGFPGLEDEIGYFYVGPEYRFYVAPRKGADGFFFGFFSRYKNGITTIDYDEWGIVEGGGYEYRYQEERTQFQKLSIGFSFGGKWVTDNGLTIGLFTSFGRNIFAQYDAVERTRQDFEEDTYEVDYLFGDNDSRYLDYRFGFTLGYRFK